MGAERGEGSTRYGRKHGPFGDSRNKDIESKDSRSIAARANEMETPVLPLANSEVILRTKVICVCTTSVVLFMDVAYGRLLRLQYNDTTIMYNYHANGVGSTGNFHLCTVRVRSICF